MEFPQYNNFDSIPRLKVVNILMACQEMMIGFECDELDDIESAIARWDS